MATSFADIYIYRARKEKKEEKKEKILNATNLEYTGPDTGIFSDSG